MPTEYPWLLTATEGVRLVREGALKPSAWLEACLRRISEIEACAKAWAFLDQSVPRAAARALDGTDWAKTRPEPLLAGLPLGIKDCFNTADMPTAMGSDLWKGFTPGNNARVVHRAKLLGAVAVGKTVTAEFATHAPGSTRNPRSTEHIPGTSSTGSAVAVACGMVPAALGTQTAGSIIRPASYCGVVGFKPSFGLVPRTGVLKTADTLDTIGWFARTVADIRLLLDALRVKGRDYPPLERGLTRAAARRDSNRPWRLALATTHVWSGAEGHARDAVVQFARQAGNRPDIDVDEMDLTATFADAHDAQRTIYHKQLSYYFEQELKNPDKVSDIFRRITEEGRRITPAQYLAATRRQREMEAELDRALEGFDALITLSTSGEPPRVTDGPERDDSALIWTMCGGPSINLPLFVGPHGMPFGAQLVAPRYADYTLLDLAETLFPGKAEVVDPSDVTTAPAEAGATVRRGAFG